MLTLKRRFSNYRVDPGGPVVSILSTGSEVRVFKPGSNHEYDFLRKGSKALGPVSQIYGT